MKQLKKPVKPKVTLFNLNKIICYKIDLEAAINIIRSYQIRELRGWDLAQLKRGEKWPQEMTKKGDDTIQINWRN